MKKIINALLIVVLLGALVMEATAVIMTITSHVMYKPDDIYALTTEVTSVNENTDEVECEDFNGNIWVFKGVSDWCEGDIASLIMDNKGTKDIYDDEIVNTRCSGYWKKS